MTTQISVSTAIQNITTTTTYAIVRNSISLGTATAVSSTVTESQTNLDDVQANRAAVPTNNSMVAIIIGAAGSSVLLILFGATAFYLAKRKRFLAVKQEAEASVAGREMTATQPSYQTQMFHGRTVNVNTFLSKTIMASLNLENTAMLASNFTFSQTSLNE